MTGDPDCSASPSVTVFVCQSCGLDDVDNAANAAGARLLKTLRDQNPDPAHITITGVDCLAACERPVTLAFAATGKWSYVLGNVDPARDVDDIFLAAQSVAASPYGVPALEDRPAFFRNGVVSRVPPPGWEMP